MNLKNSIYYGADDKASLFDLERPENWNGELIIFCHGFMGFKDWGAWNLVQSYFVNQGFGFAKLNLSHNGATITEAFDFPDEESFAKNTYSKEIIDLTRFREHLLTLIQPQKVHLIGHSRGGGDVILHAKKVACDSITLWASISDIASRFPGKDELTQWKNKGFREVLNGRTRQYLKQNYSLYEDFKTHEKELSITSVLNKLNIPMLVVHGDSDTSISMEEAKYLSQWSQHPLEIIENADHVFGAKHPWRERTMPSALQEVCQKTLNFLNSTALF